MPKFVARKPEKEVISMRISVDMLKEVDDKAATVGISRNELMNQMIAYALANMDDTPNKIEKPLRQLSQGLITYYHLLIIKPYICRISSENH